MKSLAWRLLFSRLHDSRSRSIWMASAAVFILFLAFPQASPAQRPQITTQVPFRAVNDNFFERIGFSANFRGRGFSLNLGGFPLAVPQFGNFQPGAGLRGGFAAGRGNFGFEFSQGSRRSNVMQSGSLTMFNGVPGFLADVTQSPFVISAPMMKNHRIPWRHRLGELDENDRSRSTTPQSRAGKKIPAKNKGAFARQAISADRNRPIRSVAQIRREQTARENADNRKVLPFIQRAQAAEKDGKISLAKIYYRIAARDASGELKQRLLKQLNSLGK